MDDLTRLKALVDNFSNDRNWGQFHSPKNLSMALSIEASELMEEFLWLTENESRDISTDKLSRIKDEVGDVTICLLRLSSVLQIDLLKATEEKLEKNRQKYPVEKSKNNAKKYNEL